MVTRTYDENTVIVFDTTLRDGEQSPGATLSSAEKLEIARQLSRLGVDVIEAGFPAASPDDLKAVQRIAREVGTSDGPSIAGFVARARRRYLDRPGKAFEKPQNRVSTHSWARRRVIWPCCALIRKRACSASMML